MGFQWFEQFFTAWNFKRMIVNTIKLSLYGFLWAHAFFDEVVTYYETAPD